MNRIANWTFDNTRCLHGKRQRMYVFQVENVRGGFQILIWRSIKTYFIKKKLDKCLKLTYKSIGTVAKFLLVIRMREKCLEIVQICESVVKKLIGNLSKPSKPFILVTIQRFKT